MSASKLPAAARGRQLALLTACHLESHPRAEHASAWDMLWEQPPGHDGSELPGLLGDKGAVAFARQLLGAWISHASEVDAKIEAVSRRWRLARMDVVDRNIIRLAMTELEHVPKAPATVVLAEAVRLAARYGSERSARFVNGVVGGVVEGRDGV